MDQETVYKRVDRANSVHITSSNSVLHQPYNVAHKSFRNGIVFSTTILDIAVKREFTTPYLSQSKVSHKGLLPGQ